MRRAIEVFTYFLVVVFLFLLVLWPKDISSSILHDYDFNETGKMLLEVSVLADKKPYIKFNSQGGQIGYIPIFSKLLETNNKKPVITENCTSACFTMLLHLKKFYVKEDARLGYHCIFIPKPFGLTEYFCGTMAQTLANFSQHEQGYFLKKLLKNKVEITVVTPKNFEEHFNSHKVTKHKTKPYYEFERKW